MIFAHYVHLKFLYDTYDRASKTALSEYVVVVRLSRMGS